LGNAQFSRAWSPPGPLFKEVSDVHVPAPLGTRVPTILFNKDRACVILIQKEFFDVKPLFQKKIAGPH
jgi:hypothetical protein